MLLTVVYGWQCVLHKWMRLLSYEDISLTSIFLWLVNDPSCTRPLYALHKYHDVCITCNNICTFDHDYGNFILTEFINTKSYFVRVNYLVDGVNRLAIFEDISFLTSIFLRLVNDPSCNAMGEHSIYHLIPFSCIQGFSLKWYDCSSNCQCISERENTLLFSERSHIYHLEWNGRFCLVCGKYG